MLPAYVVHCMEGRARLRHPALGEVAVRAAAQNALGNEEGVEEVRFGAESLLLLLQPGVDVAGLCARLETSVPVLASGRSPRLSRKSWRTGGSRLGGGDDCSGPGASSQNHSRFHAERGAWRSDGGQTSARQPMREARLSR